MKKSEKVKGQEKAARQKEQYKLIAVIAIVAVVVIGVAVYFAYFSSPVIQIGDTVSVTYTGMFENKTVFDSNANSSPLSFVVGGGQMIPGFDMAVQGMKLNQEKTITIPYDQAYGAYNPSLVMILPKSDFENNASIYPGEQFETSIEGTPRVVTVVNVTNTGVAIDANSPLAGQNLTFDIKIDSITKGTSSANTAAVPTY